MEVTDCGVLLRFRDNELIRNSLCWYIILGSFNLSQNWNLLRLGIVGNITVHSLFDVNREKFYVYRLQFKIVVLSLLSISLELEEQSKQCTASKLAS